jgi:hypothetical protein
MHAFLLSGLASLAFAALATIVWHYRRKRCGWPSRRQDYTWVFLHAGVVYVVACILVEHHVYKVPFDTLLANGYGDQQVNVAFAAAIFESLRALLNMWTGEDVL